MKQNFKNMTLCLLLCVLLLTACGKQAVEEPTLPQGTTQVTQPQTQPTYPLGEGELPPVAIPSQTQPVTEPTHPPETEPAQTTTPTHPPETEPGQTTTPTQPPETEPAQTTTPTQPPETEPVETTQPFEVEDNELPPIVVG